jgi:hypothetical protein
LSTEDKLHIMELCHRFDRAVNMGELEKVSQCFTEKGLVQSPKGTVQGRQQLVEYFTSTRPFAEGNRHLTCNIIVEPDGEQGAVATSYRILHKATNPPGLIASGIIEDKLVQVGTSTAVSCRRRSFGTMLLSWSAVPQVTLLLQQLFWLLGIFATAYWLHHCCVC